MEQPILIATDFNPDMPHVMEQGIRLAKALQTHIVLVHAVEPIDEPDTADHETESFHADLIVKAEAKMAEEKASRTDEVDLRTLVELGRRVDVLLRLVEERKPLMLVMGSPFRNSTPPVGIGLHLLVRCSCPVLIVPKAQP